MAQLFTLPQQVRINSSGRPYGGALAYFYRVSTETAQAVYTTPSLATPHSQPVEADSAGQFPPIWLDDDADYDYRVVIRTAGGALLDDYTIARSAVDEEAVGDAMNPRTAAEIAASITPTDTTYPEMDLRRYGGAAGASAATNDTAFEAATLVSGQNDKPIIIEGSGWAFSSPWVLTGTGQGYGGIGAVVGGAGARGCRVRGVGRPIISFSALTSTQDAITLGGANLPQVELRNLQIDCNAIGRDGVVLRGGNKPVLENLLIIDAERDGFVMEVNGTNGEWVEKGQFDIQVRFCGRHGHRRSLTGGSGTNPYINENLYISYEMRGCSVRYNSGAYIYTEAVTGLGGAAKVSDNKHFNPVADCIWETGDPFTPDVSPCRAAEYVVVQNESFYTPAWENTSADSPGVGYCVALSGSATWSGLLMLMSLTNSYWGSSGIDPAIEGVVDHDYSFHRTRFPGPLTVDANDTAAGVSVRGRTTAPSTPDYSAVRTGSAVDAVGRGAAYVAGNSTGNTYFEIGEYNGDIVFRSFSGGVWTEVLRILANGTLVTTGPIAMPDGISTPSAIAGKALLYVDSGDGDADIKFSDNFVRTIGADS